MKRETWFGNLIIFAGLIVVGCTGNGALPGTSPTVSLAVQAGAPLPMLQDIDPEDLDPARDVAGVAPVATARSAPSNDATATYRDGWMVTPVMLGEQAPGRASVPAAGLRFVYVTIRIKNGGPVGSQVYPSEFKLQDGTALRRDIVNCTECRSDLLPHADLGPGGSVTGSLIFPAPVGDSRLSLVYYRPGYREALWTFR